jgi:proteasome assembly chaperone (PAC2) family protein
MTDWIQLDEIPQVEELYLIAGWRQWADAGAVSSGLPQYLISHTDAKKVGEMDPDGFYLFQIPGTHNLLRPEVKFQDGYSESIEPHRNEFYFTDVGSGKGLLIFLGEEPHMSIDRYADGLYWVMQKLFVQRMAIVGGVYGAMPYDKDREVSCSYSLRSMYDELKEYAVRFSNYNGGATIGSFIVDRAKLEELEVFTFNAFVPHYDFSPSSSNIQGVRIEHDFKAWYELMRRFNHMFGLGIDLSDLDRQSDALISSIDAKIEEIERTMPQMNVRSYLEKISEEFEERTFLPLDDVWERELGDLLDDLDEK